MKEDPPLEAKCRDKFLVQSVLVPGETDNNVTTLWSNIEKTAKSSIQEKKIRVNFLPSGGASVATTNGVSTHGVSTQAEQLPAYSSPTPQFGSPAPSEKPRSEQAATEQVQSTASNVAHQTGLYSAAATVANAVPTSSNEVKEQLAAAQAQISKLTSQVQDPQMRQRKSTEGQEKVQAVVQQSSQGGVPLPIVAALCLLSFLIAYLFF